MLAMIYLFGSSICLSSWHITWDSHIPYGGAWYWSQTHCCQCKSVGAAGDRFGTLPSMGSSSFGIKVLGLSVAPPWLSQASWKHSWWENQSISLYLILWLSNKVERKKKILMIFFSVSRLVFQERKKLGENPRNHVNGRVRASRGLIPGSWHRWPRSLGSIGVRFTSHIAGPCRSLLWFCDFVPISKPTPQWGNPLQNSLAAPHMKENLPGAWSHYLALLLNEGKSRAAQEMWLISSQLQFLFIQRWWVDSSTFFTPHPHWHKNQLCPSAVFESLGRSTTTHSCTLLSC